MIKLTQSTARSLPVMLIDSDDHVAPKTGIVEGSVTVVISKDGGALTGFTLTDKWTELGQGLYTIDFAVGDLNTVGFFAYLVTAAGCDQYAGMMYVEAAATDAATIADAVWDEVISAGTHDVANSAAIYLRNLYQTLVTRIALAQAGANGSITLDAAASAVNDYYKGQIIAVCGGTGAGQAKACYGYDGGTKVALIRPVWATNPDNTSWYAVLNVGSTVVAAIDDIDFSDTMKASLNTEVDNALNTQIPADPTVGSVNDVLGETYAAAVIAAAGSVTIEGDVADLQDTVDAVQDSIDTAQTDLTYVKQKESGRWKIENNQLTYYEDDGTTVLRQFNLFNSRGLPTNQNPYERVPV